MSRYNDSSVRRDAEPPSKLRFVYIRLGLFYTGCLIQHRAAISFYRTILFFFFLVGHFFVYVIFLGVQLVTNFLNVSL